MVQVLKSSEGVAIFTLISLIVRRKSISVSSELRQLVLLPWLRASFLLQSE